MRGSPVVATLAREHSDRVTGPPKDQHDAAPIGTGVEDATWAAWRPRETWLTVGAFVIWSALVGAALMATLDSLRTDEFDGLNNVLQIPFALPWCLIPIGDRWSHETDAWIVAGMGWFNGLLILALAPTWIARRRRHA